MFKLEIKLGNAAMLSCHDVALALQKVSAALMFNNETSDCGNIRDANGNKVGTWEIEGAETE